MSSALRRGLAILELFARLNTPLSFSLINQHLGRISRATLSRLLTTMIEEGYVNKDATTGLYNCGYRMAVFSRLRAEGRQEYLINRYLESMTSISERFHVTTVLTERVQDTFIGIYRHQLNDTVQMQSIGHVNDQPEQPWMILMASVEPRLREYCKSPSLIRQINEAEKEGYAYADVGSIGFRRMCFPIIDSQQQLIGAIGIGGTAAQITDRNRKTIAGFVQKKLGYC